MLVSKNVAELCALLVDEIFGELPARISSVLLNRGRMTLPQLVQETSLTPRQLRHGLVVLIQHNLVYYFVDTASKMTTYEADADATYSILRIGRILEMVEAAFGDEGSDAKDIMNNILVAGQICVADLRAAYQKRQAPHEAAHGDLHGSFDMEDGKSRKSGRGVSSVISQSHLDTVLSKLAEADLVEIVTPRSFHNPRDVYREAEKRIVAKDFPGGPKSEKQKASLQEAIYTSFEGSRAESRSLKRKLVGFGSTANKRQRLFLNGDTRNGFHSDNAHFSLDSSLVVRVNLEKSLVDLRNRRLVHFAMDTIGETTGRIYATLLQLLSRQTGRCRQDRILDAMGEGYDPESPDRQVVTTAEILNHLSVSLDVSLGVGKASSSSINRWLAENIQRHAPEELLSPDEAEVDGDASSDEESDTESDVSSVLSNRNAARVNGIKSKPALNGRGELDVEIVEPPGAKVTRIDHLRQHLLLLCNSRQKFVRHCDKNEWTVDFRPLIRALQESELDVVVERTCGRHGMRLVRILREKGKLDEKTLPSIALLKKADVQNKMLEMQMAGFVDIQEVPRDTNRTASRTMFLWFTDTDRCVGQLLENTYKSMLRTLQNLAVHRQRDQEVLSLAQRSDVRGREKEMMETATYNRFVRFKDLESKLLGEIMRLDDLVAILRDY